MAVAAAVLFAGCGDRELPLDKENKVTEAWGRVIEGCVGQPPTPLRLRRARAAADEIARQYRQDPDATAQIRESDDPEPLSKIIGYIAAPSPPWWPECRELSRRAGAVVHRRPQPLSAPTTTRASFLSQVARRFPGLGTLTLRCDRFARQFFTRFVPARADINVRIRLNTDGFRDPDRVRFDPVPRRGIAAPLAARGQSWRIRYFAGGAPRLAKVHLRLLGRGPGCATSVAPGRPAG